MIQVSTNFESRHIQMLLPHLSQTPNTHSLELLKYCAQFYVAYSFRLHEDILLKYQVPKHTINYQKMLGISEQRKLLKMQLR